MTGPRVISSRHGVSSHHYRYCCGPWYVAQGTSCRQHMWLLVPFFALIVPTSVTGDAVPTEKHCTIFKGNS